MSSHIHVRGVWSEIAGVPASDLVLYECVAAVASDTSWPMTSMPWPAGLERSGVHVVSSVSLERSRLVNSSIAPVNGTPCVQRASASASTLTVCGGTRNGTSASRLRPAISSRAKPETWMA